LVFVEEVVFALTPALSPREREEDPLRRCATPPPEARGRRYRKERPQAGRLCHWFLV